jgi:hypothetical protein
LTALSALVKTIAQNLQLRQPERNGVWNSRVLRDEPIISLIDFSRLTGRRDGRAK